jgi:transcriptional regulator with XRE-family HTH domain
MQHFGEFLSAHLRLLGIVKQEDAIAYLRSRGIEVSASSLSWYLSGTRRPRRGRMEALLDALDVPVRGDMRLHAYRLAEASPADDSEPTDGAS